MNEQLTKKVEPEFLNNSEKLLALFKKLEDVYKNRPEIDSFVGAMMGTKYENEYSQESINKDKTYVEKTRKEIDQENSSFGKQNLDKLESGFQLSEILQAMIVDRLNKNWFKEIKATMTSDYDDLGGIDAVMKHENGGYLGVSFDFTVTSKEKIIYEKLNREWENYTEKGKVRTVKYFEDPDTKEKGRLLVPKFIIGASKRDVEELSNAYLDNNKELLENYPFKYVILLQMEEQLQTALDYYEINSNNKSLEFSKKQYDRIQTIIRKMKNEIHIDENIHKNIDLYEYTKQNISLDMMRRFRIMRERDFNK